MLGEEPFGRKKITLTFSVNWLIAISLIGVTLVIAYALSPEATRKVLVFAASVIAGIAGLFAAANAIDARLAAVDLGRKAAALTFFERWNDPKSYHRKIGARKGLKAIENLNQNSEFTAYEEKNPDDYQNILDLLNFFEELAVAIRLGLADEEVVKRGFRGPITRTWHRTKKFVESRRSERNNARIWQELEWLSQRWA